MTGREAETLPDPAARLVPLPADRPIKVIIYCCTWIRDRGWVKNLDPDPEQPGSYLRELKKLFFGLKYLFFDADPGSGWKNLDSGSEINIPDP